MTSFPIGHFFCSRGVWYVLCFLRGCFFFAAGYCKASLHHIANRVARCRTSLLVWQVQGTVSCGGKWWERFGNKMVMPPWKPLSLRYFFLGGKLKKLQIETWAQSFMVKVLQLCCFSGNFLHISGCFEASKVLFFLSHPTQKTRNAPENTSTKRGCSGHVLWMPPAGVLSFGAQEFTWKSSGFDPWLVVLYKEWNPTPVTWGWNLWSSFWGSPKKPTNGISGFERKLSGNYHLVLHFQLAIALV